MYSHEEDIDGAIEVFKQAIEHYQSEQVCVRILLRLELNGKTDERDTRVVF